MVLANTSFLKIIEQVIKPKNDKYNYVTFTTIIYMSKGESKWSKIGIASFVQNAEKIFHLEERKFSFKNEVITASSPITRISNNN